MLFALNITVFYHVRDALYSGVHAFPYEIVDGGQKQQDAAAFKLQNASHAAG